MGTAYRSPPRAPRPPSPKCVFSGASARKRDADTWETTYRFKTLARTGASMDELTHAIETSAKAARAFALALPRPETEAERLVRTEDERIRRELREMEVRK